MLRSSDEHLSPSEPPDVVQEIATRFDFPHYLLLAGPEDGPRTVVTTNWDPTLISACTNQTLLFRNRFVAKLGAQLLPSVDLRGLLFERENGDRQPRMVQTATAFGIKETLGLRIVYSKHVAYTALLSAPKLPSIDTAAVVFELIKAANSLGQKGVGSRPLPSLTIRELECLKWIAAGKSSKDVGAILEISAHTVNDYMKRVFEKLGATNRVQAVGIAFQLNLI